MPRWRHFHSIALVTGLFIGASGCDSSGPSAPVPASSIEAVTRAVAEASEADRAEVATAAIEQVIRTDPGRLEEVLAAVVKRAPETAPACARAAVIGLPDRAADWVLVVAGGAPDYASLIVREVCLAKPDQYAAVTVAAGRAAPLSSHSIMLALAEAIPDLRDTIERAKTLAGKGRTSHPSVSVVIAQTLELAEVDRVSGEGGQ